MKTRADPMLISITNVGALAATRECVLGSVALGTLHEVRIANGLASLAAATTAALNVDVRWRTPSNSVLVVQLRRFNAAADANSSLGVLYFEASDTADGAPLPVLGGRVYRRLNGYSSWWRADGADNMFQYTVATYSSWNPEGTPAVIEFYVRRGPLGRVVFANTSGNVEVRVLAGSAVLWETSVMNAGTVTVFPVGVA